MLVEISRMTCISLDMHIEMFFRLILATKFFLLAVFFLIRICCVPDSRSSFRRKVSLKDVVEISGNNVCILYFFHPALPTC